MITGIDPKVDYVFKILCGTEANKPILLYVLDAVLQPPADAAIVNVEFRNPFNDKETEDDKLSILDIIVRDQQGKLYNIEMQMEGYKLYPQRALYYWSTLYSGQLQEGQDYSQLRATISINFVNGILFPKIPDFHLDFQLRSSQHKDLIFSPLQSIHVVELPKFRKGPKELATPFEAWCYFLKHGADLDTDDLPELLRNPPMLQAVEVLKMIAQNDIERERYEARQKFLRDQKSYISEARQEGRQEGRVEGRQEGGLVARVQLCEQLLKLPVTPVEALLELSLNELRAKAESLEQKLGVKQP